MKYIFPLFIGLFGLLLIGASVWWLTHPAAPKGFSKDAMLISTATIAHRAILMVITSSTELLKITCDGKIISRGKLVATDREMASILGAKFCPTSNQ